MTQDPLPSRCFTCGGAADALNEIAEGENCPACAERLLEDLPGIFHEPWAQADQVEAELADIEAVVESAVASAAQVDSSSEQTG